MSSIKQIVIILLAALVVTGALYGYGQMNGAAAGENGRFGEFERRDDFEGRGEFGEGRPPRGEGDTGLVPFNVRGILGFGQTLVPITIIIIVVALINRVTDATRRHSAKPAQE